MLKYDARNGYVNMQAVILAAGKGTRLGKIASKHSKAMLPIAARPMVERVMRQIDTGWIDQFILVISPEDREIKAYFQQNRDYSGRVEFALQERQLGMAHALRCAAGLIRDDFLLSACDNLVSRAHISEMLKVWELSPGICGILSLIRMDPAAIQHSAAVELDGDLVCKIIEKPPINSAPSNIASLPLYIVSSRILDQLACIEPSVRDELELQEAIQGLIQAHGNVLGILTEDRITLTTSQDLLYINKHYLKSGGFISMSFTETVGKGTRLIPPYVIESGVIIGEDCTIGPCVTIGAGSTISDGTIIKNSVLLGGSSVKKPGYINEIAGCIES